MDNGEDRDPRQGGQHACYPVFHTPVPLMCAEAAVSGRGSGRPVKRKKLYAEHKSPAEIAAGIKDGRYHQVGGTTSRGGSTIRWTVPEVGSLPSPGLSPQRLLSLQPP